MTILDKIVDYKRNVVEEAKSKTPLNELKNMEMFNRKPLPLKQYFNKEKTGIIAEFKRKSPSKGIINNKSEVHQVVKGYEIAGASAISVLTDEQFFGGNLNDLQLARKVLSIPLLRKDFIIDTYQIYEAKAYGADVILLIAAILSKEQIWLFSETAKELGLSILFEIHNESELKKINDNIDIVGVNNRNLKTFKTSIENSLKLGKLIPDDKIKISESGISDVNKIKLLKSQGFNGFLIGENFMKTENPAKAAIDFMKMI